MTDSSFQTLKKSSSSLTSSRRTTSARSIRPRSRPKPRKNLSIRWKRVRYNRRRSFMNKAKFEMKLRQRSISHVPSYKALNETQLKQLLMLPPMLLGPPMLLQLVMQKQRNLRIQSLTQASSLRSSELKSSKFMSNRLGKVRLIARPPCLSWMKSKVSSFATHVRSRASVRRLQMS